MENITEDVLPDTIQDKICTAVLPQLYKVNQMKVPEEKKLRIIGVIMQAAITKYQGLMGRSKKCTLQLSIKNATLPVPDSKTLDSMLRHVATVTRQQLPASRWNHVLDQLLRVELTKQKLERTTSSTQWLQAL